MDDNRFKKLIQFLKNERHIRNQQDFAERVESDKATVSQVINGKIKPPASLLNGIQKAFPFISIEWVKGSEGDMIVQNKLSTPTDYRLVPLINIDSVGGLHSENITTPSEQYLIKMIPFTEARDGDVAIIQSGNSMYPTIPPGSALLIREVVDWRQYFGYGGIFVLWLTDGRRITKEIRRYDADPKNYVWCVSYNSDVADEELPKSMIRGVWKVVKYIADFGW